MKRKKPYILTIAILLIIIGCVAIVYWKGYNKQANKKNIPSNATAIVLIDIREIQNYFILSYLKNPSLWQFSINNSEKNQAYKFEDYGIEIPDYVSIFQLKDQTIDQWNFVAKIEDQTKFDTALQNFHFIKTESRGVLICYYSKDLEITIIRHENQILFSNNASKHHKISLDIAEDLFIKERYFDFKKIEQLINLKSGVAIWIQKNSLLEEESIITISLKANEITAEGKLNWKAKYRKNFAFVQNPNALFSIGFNFEMIQENNILNRNTEKINKIIGFKLDSIIALHPNKTELVLHSIIEKKDSAITYDYDDDFNPIKKVVVHSNREPSFRLSIQTDNAKKVYNYLQTQHAIDKSGIFINFPLATTQTTIENETVTLVANPFVNHSTTATSQTGYLHLNFNAINPKEWRFLIAKNENLGFLQSFKYLKINITQENNFGHLQATLQTKEEKDFVEIVK